MRITIEKEIDNLTKETFYFYQIDNNLYLDNYTLMKRETAKTKKYTTEKKYDRLNLRDSNMTESDVPLTFGIRVEALQKFTERVKVLLWSERGNN